MPLPYTPFVIFVALLLHSAVSLAEGGDKVVGTLSSDLPRLGGDGSPVLSYTFSPMGGEKITVTLYSATFTPYFFVGRMEKGVYKKYGFGSGTRPGDTATLDLYIPESESYDIVVSAMEQDPRGDFTLEIAPFKSSVSSSAPPWDGMKWTKVAGSDEWGDVRGIWGPDNRTLYVVGGSVRQTDDGGVTWRISDAQAAYGVWGSKDDVVAVGKSIRWSGDRGKTWKEAVPAAPIFAVTAWGRGDQLYVSGTEGIVLHSANRGITWTPTSTLGTSDTLSILWGNKDDVFVVRGRNEIVASRDGGKTWKAEKTGLIESEEINAIWGSGETDIFAVGHTHGEGGGVFLHRGANNVWTRLEAPGALVSKIWGTSPTDFYCVISLGTLMHTKDGGKTWSKSIKSGGILRQVWGSSAGDVYVGGERGLWHGRAVDAIAPAPGTPSLHP